MLGRPDKGPQGDVLSSNSKREPRCICNCYYLYSTPVTGCVRRERRGCVLFSLYLYSDAVVWNLVASTHCCLCLSPSLSVSQAIRSVLWQDVYPQIKLWEFYQVKVDNTVEQFRILLLNGWYSPLVNCAPFNEYLYFWYTARRSCQSWVENFATIRNVHFSPIKITSVLSEFNIRKLLVTQVLMSLRHSWSLTRWPVSSGLIDRYFEFCLHKQWGFMQCFLITFPKGSIQRVEKNASSTEPCGTQHLVLWSKWSYIENVISVSIY